MASFLRYCLLHLLFSFSFESGSLTPLELSKLD